MDKRLKPYPEPTNDVKRLVIILAGRGNDDPHSGPIDGEDDLEVELIPGKTMLSDGVNHVRLGGTSITEKIVQGWGYPYWEVMGNTDNVISTMMGVPPGTEKVSTFVSGPSKKIRYNSRLPVVVYAPKDMEIRWRVWRADATTHTATEK